MQMSQCLMALVERLIRSIPVSGMFPCSITVAMHSLLTLDHTTVFFHDLCVSSNSTHSANIEKWRESLSSATRPPSTKSASTTLLSTGSDTSKSKRPHIPDAEHPTPRKPVKRSKASQSKASEQATTVEAEEEYVDDAGAGEGGGLSDHDEINGQEMVAAKNSPVKPTSARLTTSVSQCVLVVPSIINI